MLRSRKSISSFSHVGTWSKQDLSLSSMENLASDDVGWVGPINLRRRAKPELENERHRDISLRLSVQEVKQLPSKGRYFCELCLDRTLYARTTSKQSDGTVFWGEKFELNNLPDVSIITINLYKQADPTKEKRNRAKGQNQLTAFVTIPLKEVPQKSELQQWFPMQSPHLIQLDQWQGGSNSISSPGAPRFRKRSTPIACFRHSTSASTFGVLNEAVEEGSPLSDTKPGAPIPVTCRGRKKSSWSAGVGQPDKESIREPRLGGRNTTNSTTARIGSERSGVSPPYVSSGPTFILSDNGPLPQIRVNLQYEAMDVLPIAYYGELREFIKLNSLPLVRFLEPQLTAKQKEELASCLVNIHEKLPDLSVAQLLTDLLHEELQQHNDESMIFRSNSTGSKAVECYIKLVGNEYLQHTLKKPIDQLLSATEDFEIDPSRVQATEQNGTVNSTSLSVQVEKNRNALIRHLNIIWDKISSSVSLLPRELREVFASLSDSLEQTHGAKTAAQLISSCLFLRFICPAIHGPVLFGLTTAVPECVRLSRNLTLVAKVMQNLANFALFEEKERHMRTLNAFVEAEIPRMRKFLHTVSVRPAEEDQTAKDPDCHKFIDLSYEFAKLTSLLVAYTRSCTLPDELTDLLDILQFIDEHTNDAVLASWTPERITCRRYASCDSNGSLLPSRPRFNSTDSVTCVQPASANAEENEFPNDISMSPLVSKLNDSGLGSQSVFLNETGSESNEQCAVSASHIAITSGIQSPTFCNPDISSKEDNTEDLIVQYEEQLRQLHACIDRVESSEVCPRAVTSYPHVMRVNEHGTATQLVTTSGSDLNSTAISAASTPCPNHTTSRATRTNGTDEMFCISDYESGDLTERSDEPCHSEPMNTPCRVPECETGKQTLLAGSPSLDQLAERLQELRLLLKHERQELEQVVATKTQAIRQQEHSIEQLAAELDQLRRAPSVGRGRSTNGGRWPSGTASPSSSCSLSSECHMVNPVDPMNCPCADELTLSSVGPGSLGLDLTQSSVSASGIPIGNGSNSRAQRFRAKAWSDRVDQVIKKPNNKNEAVSRYGPNLLDLARVSEGTGIPLGDLIVPKQAVPVRRRFSESKLLHQ